MMTLHPKVIDLTLGRVERLLAALGNPERSIPPVIHVAGTNGKGSTQAMIRAGLEAGGDRVHAYTSPHLARFHERIRLAGELISEDLLTRLLDECVTANGGEEITFFEITTCAAFLAFSRVPADWTLLEVGLGGRLDATNMIDRPRLTIITPVSLDHQAFLGDTVGAIAGEKAGIIKRGVPVIVGPQTDEGLQVIEAQAARLGAPVLAHGQHWHVSEDRGRLVYQDESGLLDLPLPNLPGPHQIQNAGAAIAALRYLGRDEAACEAAVTRAEWPARMQRLRHGPLVELAPKVELWLDGGHNPGRGRGRGGHARPVPRARDACDLRNAEHQGRQGLHDPACAPCAAAACGFDPRREEHAAGRGYPRCRAVGGDRSGDCGVSGRGAVRDRGDITGSSGTDLGLALPCRICTARERLSRRLVMTSSLLIWLGGRGNAVER
jgi:dihydrofolate synthase / folylpolyglutamate synthase